MKFFRMSVHLLLITGLLFATASLYGCRKEEGSVKNNSTTDTVDEARKEETPAPSTAPITEEKIYYDFETDLGGWEVPLWASSKSDYVANIAPEISKDFASHGNYSMKIMADFPGQMWSAALVEIQHYLDLSASRALMADIYIPEDAPLGLKVKLILTVGESWKFVEMNRTVPLIPGEWATISANIAPGSYDWKRIVPERSFSEDVRKIAIRIESNRKPKYAGPVYIDNIRVGK